MTKRASSIRTCFGVTAYLWILLFSVAGVETATDKGRVYDSVDEPPVARVQTPSRQSEAFRSRKIQAETTLDLVVSPEGAVSEVTILQSSDPDYAESVRAGVLRWRFQPGRLNGNPVSVRLRQKVKYTPSAGSADQPFGVEVATTSGGGLKHERIAELKLYDAAALIPVPPRDSEIRALAGSPAALRGLKRSLIKLFQDETLLLERVKIDERTVVCPSLQTRYLGADYQTLLADLTQKRNQLDRSTRVEIHAIEGTPPRIGVFPFIVLKKGDLMVEMQQRLFFYFTDGKVSSVEWGADANYQLH